MVSVWSCLVPFRRQSRCHVDRSSLLYEVFAHSSQDSHLIWADPTNSAAEEEENDDINTSGTLADLYLNLCLDLIIYIHFTQISMDYSQLALQHRCSTIGIPGNGRNSSSCPCPCTWDRSTVDLCTQLTTKECLSRRLSNYTLCSRITLHIADKGNKSGGNDVYTPELYSIRVMKMPLPARGKSLLKILWNQAAQQRNPNLQTTFIISWTTVLTNKKSLVYIIKISFQPSLASKGSVGVRRRFE